jgi:CheY-like chemotaxis protein
MRISHIEHGVFSEIEKYNTNFHPGSDKLRFLIDTSVDASLLGGTKELDLDLFIPFFSTLSFHSCGCGKGDADAQQDYVFESSDSIVSLKASVDIAHYMEHMILDLQYDLGTRHKISGVTVKLESSAHEFMTYVECDDVHLAMFSLNIVLAMMHQALYCSVIDPRYRTVLKIAKWLRTREYAAVPLSDITKEFDIDEAMVHFCINALNIFEFSKNPVSVLPAPTPQTMGPILIIEDNASTRELLDEALAGLGYETMTAEDGKTGLEMLCRYNASVVLLDIYLPDTDGVSIAQWILESQPSIMVVLMSGKIDMDEGATFSSDAVRFIPKPFSISQLEDILAVACAQGSPVPDTRITERDGAVELMACA